MRFPFAGAVRALGLAGASMTLMACYGNFGKLPPERTCSPDLLASKGSGETDGDTSDPSLGADACTGGAEQVLEVTPVKDGTFDLSLTSATEQGLNVRAECLPKSASSCEGAPTAVQHLKVEVLAGVTTFIVVDSLGASREGPFKLEAIFTPKP